MASIDEERGAVSEDLKTFLGRMQDVAEKIHLMGETNKDANRLQQKIRSAASQQHIEKDKERLDDLQESHLAAGEELKTCLKEELDILNNEERLAERENAVLLDEKNETYVKRKHLLEHYHRFHSLWKSFHTQQTDYRDIMKDLLKRRYKVVNENATDDDIEKLLDTTKDDRSIASVLKDCSLKKEEVDEIEYRCSELKELETFIGKTHNFYSELDELLTVQEGKKLEDPDTTVWTQYDLTKYQKFFLERKRTIIIVSGAFIASLFLIILISSVSSGSDLPTTTTTPTVETEPTIEPFEPTIGSR